MNLKSLRKNYDKLSKRERFILYDSAENRDDQSEMDAILLATPNQDWVKPDFALQLEQLLKMRLVNLAQRLKHSRDALLWLSLSINEELTNKSKKKERFFYESARLSAYFYCVSVDTSNSIYEELSLDIETWKTKEDQLFDLGFVDEITDLRMRNLAFDEKEAEAYINKIGKERGYKNIVLGFTYEKELKSFREILKTQGFEGFFKN
jgi:hypothetical protein